MVGEAVETSLSPAFGTDAEGWTGTVWPVAVAHPIATSSSETVLDLTINSVAFVGFMKHVPSGRQAFRRVRRIDHRLPCGRSNR
jgi:hypothetical protein